MAQPKALCTGPFSCLPSLLFSSWLMCTQKMPQVQESRTARRAMSWPPATQETQCRVGLREWRFHTPTHSPCQGLVSHSTASFLGGGQHPLIAPFGLGSVVISVELHVFVSANGEDSAAEETVWQPVAHVPASDPTERPKPRREGSAGREVSRLSHGVEDRKLQLRGKRSTNHVLSSARGSTIL
jgi:hypothetical protein